MAITIKELLNEIMDASDIQTDSSNIIIEKLRSFYEDCPRHNYHEIAQFVFDVYKNGQVDQMDYVTQRIRDMQDKIGVHDSLHSHLVKLYDHLKLEIIRIQIAQEIDNMQSLIPQVIKKIDDTSSKQDDLLKELKKQEEKLERESQNIHTQLVSVLGIFTAFVFTMFGGLSVINSVVASFMANDISSNKGYLMIIAVGFVLFNLMFFMMYFLSKLVDRSIGDPTAGDLTGKFMLVRAAKKHPVFFWFNLVIIALATIPMLTELDFIVDLFSRIKITIEPK